MRERQMSVSAQLMSRVSARVDECITKANARLGRVFTTPTIAYDVRGTVGGYYEPATHRVRFNPILLKENTDHYIQTTVAHEVAHAIDRQYNTSYRAKPHGHTWKMIMRVLGVEPKRTHSYDVENAQVRVKNKFEYRCKHCGTLITVGPQIHSKLQKGQVRWHKECGQSLGRLEYVQPLGQVTYKQVAEARANNVAPKKVEAKQQRADNGSKYEKAKAIVLEWSMHSKTTAADMIRHIEKECGMSKAGASTYYYKARKELGY